MHSCPDIQTWLTSVNRTPSLTEHIAGCPRCRAALLCIVVDLFHVPHARAQAVTCDQCQDDLAAFIDMERDAGAAQASRAYPHVWWHLWICPDCATTYQIVQDTTA